MALSGEELRGLDFGTAHIPREYFLPSIIAGILLLELDIPSIAGTRQNTASRKTHFCSGGENIERKVRGGESNIGSHAQPSFTSPSSILVRLADWQGRETCAGLLSAYRTTCSTKETTFIHPLWSPSTFLEEVWLDENLLWNLLVIFFEFCHTLHHTYHTLHHKHTRLHSYHSEPPLKLIQRKGSTTEKHIICITT